MDPEYVALEAGELGPEPRVYHQSHFWCAECGDPFLDPKCASPFDAPCRLNALATPDNPIMAPFVVVGGHPYIAV